MSDDSLPQPDSPELAEILSSIELRLIYRLLYDRRMNPPTMSEIEASLRETRGTNHSQRGRRVRDLYTNFRIEKTAERIPRYVLISRIDHLPPSGINRRLRAQVLQPQRCAMCGRRPIDDQVKLVVDHKLPKAWGGTDDLDNLQPLCEECNSGKKDLFKSFDIYADKIRQAANFDEPHRRIGELLRAFDLNEWIPSDVIALVANAKSYQEDWQKRMRELRLIGWDYSNQKRRVGNRVKSFYRLIRSSPWPDNIAGAVKTEEQRRKRASQRRRS